MIIVMNLTAGEAAIEAVTRKIRDQGLDVNVSRGTERVVIGAIGDERKLTEEAFSTMQGVEQAIHVLKPYKIVAREWHADDSTISVCGVPIGGRAVQVIAGPCSVETQPQMDLAAEGVAAAGCRLMRGGAFKPRTSPYSFQGMKEKGLELLALARQETGLAIVSEVMAPEHVPLLTRYVDVLQVGARNMQNYPLLEAVGECGKPVLLKRGPAATMDEFLLAAEYILKTGNTQVMMCERGIRTFEDHTRFTLPLATVPYLRQTTHLPVVVDPSHGTGKASLVAPMAVAAIACGADGLIVEVHPDPEKALSDGYQSLTPAAFAGMLVECRKVAQALGRKM
jgi:3-deoxy-7-phosphoheptulonate synthase